MIKEKKSNLIRKAFEEFANAHVGEELSTKQINNGVGRLVDGGLSGWCVSDFAIPETSNSRSKQNKRLFHRVKRGRYIVLGTEKTE